MDMFGSVRHCRISLGQSRRADSGFNRLYDSGLSHRRDKKLSSSAGFSGLLKKGLILIVVSVGHILDTQIFGGESSVCRSAVIGFYLANEGISILENIGKLGMPLPEQIRKVLEQLKDKE